MFVLLGSGGHTVGVVVCQLILAFSCGAMPTVLVPLPCFNKQKAPTMVQCPDSSMRVPRSLQETCSDVCLQGLPTEGTLVHLPVHTQVCVSADP